MKNWTWIIEKSYIPAMCIVAALVVWLNYHAQGMQGILPYYLDFKRIILAGFDPLAGDRGTPTFPMWGYGWILLATENKLLLLAGQSLLAIGAVVFFFRRVDGGNHLSREASALLKALLVVSLPWYVIHALLWPYSIAVSLFLISFILLVDSMDDPGRVGGIIVSGVIFGLLLNFRSDYYLMPIGLAILVLVRLGFRKAAFARTSLWLVCCYALLIPWAVYAKSTTGHYLLTSSNSGHVFFIGLGLLPDNKWGITPADNDPKMLALLENYFGTPKSSLTVESDRYLMGEFKKMVREDPAEYARKVLHSLKQAVTQGCYSGEFYEQPACQPSCLEQYQETRARLAAGLSARESPLPFRHALTLFSKLLGALVVLVSFTVSPLVLFHAVRTRSLFLLLLLAAIYYQLAINVFSYHMTNYTSNMYFFHLIGACVGLSILASFFMARLGKGSRA